MTQMRPGFSTTKSRRVSPGGETTATGWVNETVGNTRCVEKLLAEGAALNLMAVAAVRVSGWAAASVTTAKYTRLGMTERDDETRGMGGRGVGALRMCKRGLTATGEVAVREALAFAGGTGEDWINQAVSMRHNAGFPRKTKHQKANRVVPNAVCDGSRDVSTWGKPPSIASQQPSVAYVRNREAERNPYLTKM